MRAFRQCAPVRAKSGIAPGDSTLPTTAKRWSTLLALWLWAGCTSAVTRLCHRGSDVVVTICAKGADFARLSLPGAVLSREDNEEVQGFTFSAWLAVLLSP